MTYWDFALSWLKTAFDAVVIWWGLLVTACGIPLSVFTFLFTTTVIVGLFILPLRGPALSDTVKRKRIDPNSSSTKRLNSGNG